MQYCHVTFANEPFCAVCDYSESGTFRNKTHTGTFKFLKIIYVDDIINSCWM